MEFGLRDQLDEWLRLFFIKKLKRIKLMENTIKTKNAFPDDDGTFFEKRSDSYFQSVLSRA